MLNIDRENILNSVTKEDHQQFERVRQLQIPLSEIINQIKPNIKKREYGLLVSDDRGGRIPTLILGRTINKFYAQTGQDSIPSVFVQGSRNYLHLPDMLEEFESRQHILDSLKEPKRALLVTEHIGLGTTLRQFGTMFHSLNLPFDVASLESSVSQSSYQNEEVLPLSSYLFTGDSKLGVNFIDFPYTGLVEEKYTNQKFVEDPVLRQNSRLALYVAKEVSENLLEELTS